ncbi:MAG TPA: cytochrome bc complex cytochrome b subunit [Candidatus Kapabacteria bacterium]|nr:cytochrome bc complex cytochrome b subunit [Candidatus Kapabacteria bacterium]
MSDKHKQPILDSLHLRGVLDALKRKTVPKHKTSILYYMGGLALMFFTVQVLTGILLLFYYEPSAATANKSIQHIMYEVPFGSLIRSIHSWSANALVLFVFIHMFSVMLMKSYRFPHRVMWLTGFVLLLLVLGFGFTGYLLPWDETAYFATKIGAEVPLELPVIGTFIADIIKGANDVNGATLTRMFAVHVGVLPVISVLLVVAHIGMIMLFGSSSPPNAVIKGQEKYFPDFLLKELMIWLVGFGILIAIAVLYPWGVGKAFDLANPTEPPAGVHPEWYFMFLFQTLRLFPEWMVIVGFGVVAVFWAFIPWLDRRAHHNQKSPIFTWIGVAAIVYIVSLTTWAYISVGEEEAEGSKPAVEHQQPDSTHAK